VITQHITIPYDEIVAFCRRNHIRKLSLFGSALRDDFRADSDVDVLVEFDSDYRITYLDLAQMEIELSQILGRKIDLREPEELSHYFRKQVIHDAELIYERA
jgi:uncharacterized protein